MIFACAVDYFVFLIKEIFFGFCNFCVSLGANWLKILFKKKKMKGEKLLAQQELSPRDPFGCKAEKLSHAFLCPAGPLRVNPDFLSLSCSLLKPSFLDLFQ